MTPRREHGTGSVHPAHRKDCPRPTNSKGEPSCKCPWRGTLDVGWTDKGTRKRVTVTGRSKAEAQRRLRDKKAAHERGESGASRLTVKTWADQWLDLKRPTLRPNAYRAARASVRMWIVPTIGHRRLDKLTPADVRAVQNARDTTGSTGATAAAAHRTLLNMLRAAVSEGHTVPFPVFNTKGPSVARSDREPLSITEAVAALAVASELPHGTRWVFALLHGMRQGECLGATWDQLDLDRGVYTVAWQLQRIPYNEAAPRDVEVRHLHRTYHLTPPKSKAGFREIPLLPAVVDALEQWRTVAPENPWGLIWPTAGGLPANADDDREEWQALQCTAGIGHPAGRYYYVHECRNVTATQLREAGADGLVLTSLLGHTDERTSHGYMRVNLDSKRTALEQVAGVLGLG